MPYNTEDLLIGLISLKLVIELRLDKNPTDEIKELLESFLFLIDFALEEAKKNAL